MDDVCEGFRIVAIRMECGRGDSISPVADGRLLEAETSLLVAFQLSLPL